MDLSQLKPFDYFEALQYRYKITREFPFISAYTIGKSVMGREIPAFIIGEAKEYALFVGGIHGNANFTSVLLYAFFKELCNAAKNDSVIEGLKVKRAFDGRGLVVVPCLNPDGCEIAARGKSAFNNMQFSLERITKKDYKDFCYNARGVDIDKVFSANPQRQPESAALLSLLKHIPIRHLIAFEKGEGEIILPHDTSLPERATRMAEIMISSTGYKLCCGKEASSFYNLSDWFCKTHYKPSFTVLSNLKEDDYLSCYKHIREFMMLSSIM